MKEKITFENACLKCHGSGKVMINDELIGLIPVPCAACEGKGTTDKPAEVQLVKVQPGWED